MKNPFLTELCFYLRNAYPPFVRQIFPCPIKDYIPVFISHKVSPIDFEKKLFFLKENGYKTCKVSELYSFVSGKCILSGTTVCLTFDDVHESFYSVAYPLLKKYGFTATAFITPMFIGSKYWISWPQIQELAKTDTVEFQSHTLEHKRIFVSDRIVANFTEGLFKNELWLDRPTVIINGKETKDIPNDFPLYEMDSRMSDKPRYFSRGVWETKKEQSDAILFDLKESKRILEEKTQKPILHLAYPWGIGSNLSVKLCKDAGYLSNFWGPTHGIPYNKVGSDPYKLIRLKDDYIFRLPGKGRISLGSVFLKKFIRRTTAKQKGKDIY